MCMAEQSLIEKVDRLKELEKRATLGPWAYEEDAENFPDGTGNASGDLKIIDNRGCTVSTMIEYAEYENSVENAEMIVALRNAAPAILDVLSAFRDGDAVILNDTISDIRDMEDFPGQKEETELLSRFIKAARLMETRP